MDPGYFQLSLSITKRQNWRFIFLLLLLLDAQMNVHHEFLGE
jgi:hypothetical protein